MALYNNILNNYFNEPEKFFQDLKNFESKNPDENIRSIIGSHYLKKSSKDFFNSEHLIKMAEQYFKSSLNVKYSSYNLGLIYENEIRKKNLIIKIDSLDFSEINNREILNVLNGDNLFYKMIVSYRLAMIQKNYKSYNQLGAFYVHFLKLPDLVIFDNLTGVDLLEIAADNSVVEAFNNLIKLSKDDEEVIKWWKLKCKLTKSPIDLMNFMTKMTKLNRYDEYMVFYKTIQNKTNIIDEPNESDKCDDKKIIKKVHFNDLTYEQFIKNNPLVLYGDSMDCTICYENKLCVKLKCKHTTCEDCLKKIFQMNNKVCPVCRLEIN